MRNLCCKCKEFKLLEDFRYRSGDRSYELRTVCKQCEREQQQRRMQDPARKAHAAEYARKNKDKISVQRKENRELFPEKHREYVRKYHPKVRKKWREKGGPAVEREKEASRLRVRGLRDRETREYFDIIKYDICSYCGDKFEHIDHIEAITNGGGQKWDNITSACGFCNVSKKNKKLLFFMLHNLERRRSMILC